MPGAARGSVTRRDGRLRAGERRETTVGKLRRPRTDGCSRSWVARPVKPSGMALRPSGSGGPADGALRRACPCRPTPTARSQHGVHLPGNQAGAADDVSPTPRRTSTSTTGGGGRCCPVSTPRSPDRWVRSAESGRPCSTPGRARSRATRRHCGSVERWTSCPGRFTSVSAMVAGFANSGACGSIAVLPWSCTDRWWCILRPLHPDAHRSSDSRSGGDRDGARSRRRRSPGHSATVDHGRAGAWRAGPTAQAPVASPVARSDL